VVWLGIRFIYCICCPIPWMGEHFFFLVSPPPGELFVSGLSTPQMGTVVNRYKILVFLVLPGGTFGHRVHFSTFHPRALALFFVGGNPWVNFWGWGDPAGECGVFFFFSHALGGLTVGQKGGGPLHLSSWVEPPGVPFWVMVMTGSSLFHTP